jgi:hypothetical protein
MSRRAAFKQSDVTRALKGAVQAGLPVTGYRVEPDGTIMVLFEGKAPAPGANNPWDEVLR